jgi:hypothetical protein
VHRATVGYELYKVCKACYAVHAAEAALAKQEQALANVLCGRPEDAPRQQLDTVRAQVVPAPLTAL